MSGRMLSYPAWAARRYRRERLIRYGVALAAIVLPSLLAWVVLGLIASAHP